MILDNKLIKKCTCGNTTDFFISIRSDIDILTCKVCKVIHQDLEGWDNKRYYDFYKLDYHFLYQKKRGSITYEERYEHDCRVSMMRLNEYRDWFDPEGLGLDIGSSNSAFVHEARKLGFNCLGLEPGKSIGDDSVTIRGTLESVNFTPEKLSWITMHDSIEHMIDVTSALQKLYSMLKSNGVLILDLPDYFDDAGKHHWKRIEHLWFFTETQLTDLLNQHGFTVEKITKPIPGKLVFYTRK